MRSGLACVVLMGCVWFASAQEEETFPKRFNIPGNPKVFPQSTPKDTLASVLKAIEKERLDYLVAHLMEPTFVDARIVDLYKPRVDQSLQKKGITLDKADLERAYLDAFVADIQQLLTDKPEVLKEMKQFLREGELQTAGDTGTLKLKDLKDRQIYFKKDKNRWFMENRRSAEAAPEPK